jgi:hypothetical protein
VIWKEDNSGLLSENALKNVNGFSKLALFGYKKHVSTLSKKTRR